MFIRPCLRLFSGQPEMWNFNMPIHLHTQIKRLKKQVDGVAPLEDVNATILEIIDSCDRLIEEHGKGSDVGIELIFIKENVGKIPLMLVGKYASKKTQNDSDPEYDKAKNTVGYMEESIGKIGKYLSIEFKEVDS